MQNHHQSQYFPPEKILWLIIINPNILMTPLTSQSVPDHWRRDPSLRWMFHSQALYVNIFHLAAASQFLGLVLYGHKKLQTSRRNYFKKHPVLTHIVLWRKLRVGKQQHAPHMALFFLLKSFVSNLFLIRLWRMISSALDAWIRLIKSSYQDCRERLGAPSVPH